MKLLQRWVPEVKYLLKTRWYFRLAFVLFIMGALFLAAFLLFTFFESKPTRVETYSIAPNYAIAPGVEKEVPCGGRIFGAPLGLTSEQCRNLDLRVKIYEYYDYPRFILVLLIIEGLYTAISWLMLRVTIYIAGFKFRIS